MSIMKRKKRRLIVLSTLAAVVVGGVFWILNNTSARFFTPYLSMRPDAIQGHIDERNTGEKSQTTEMTYIVYFPHDYEKAYRSYGVIYHLHGMSPAPWWITKRMLNLEVNQIAYHLEDAVALGEAEPMIIVAPYDGYGRSMWSNSADGQNPVETDFIQSLIPHIDATYRTIPQRESRVLQGFSMGGFGAVKTTAKYPHLFGTVISWDGALHTWETLSQRRADIAEDVFNNDKSYFAEYSPARWINENAKLLRNEVAVKLVVGELTDLNRELLRQLEAENIPVEYVETDCQHNLFCMMDRAAIP